MEPGRSYEENTYVNVVDLGLQRIKNAPTSKGARSTQSRVILILGVLLILAFITLVIRTTFLFICYKSIGEEMSQMRNDSDVKHNLTDQVTDSSDPLCSEGWRHYGLSCYYLSSDSQPWNASKKDCEDKKAHLVVINSEGEMNFLRGIANKKFLWIGLTDADGTWRWVDGTPYDITPKFWGMDQPDDWKGHGFGGGEDCVMLRPTNDWNDGHCSEIMHYVCEKKMIV